MKIEVGSRWKNKHTKENYCTVLSKVFFNIHIQYDPRPGMPSYDGYWHYKKFLKHWDKQESDKVIR